MIKLKKPKGYWSKERCLEVALLCKTKGEFKKDFLGAFKSANKNKWYVEICFHMEHGKLIWNKNNCLIEAKKYETRGEFREKSNGAYISAWNNIWLDEICTHMINGRIKLYLNYCRELALKCETRSEFKKRYNPAYKISCKNKWLDEICSHMLEIQKPNGYWNFKKCYEEALKYDTLSDFIKFSGRAYKVSLNSKWVDEICNHMVRKIIPYSYWNYENCKNISLNCKNITEFRKKSDGVYMYSLNNKLLDEFFPKNK